MNWELRLFSVAFGGQLAWRVCWSWVRGICMEYRIQTDVPSIKGVSTHHVSRPGEGPPDPVVTVLSRMPYDTPYAYSIASPRLLPPKECVDAHAPRRTRVRLQFAAVGNMSLGLRIPVSSGHAKTDKVYLDASRRFRFSHHEILRLEVSVPFV